MANPRRLVLASTSPFRRELLGRLGLPFETRAPEVDESRLAGEDPEDLVRRLAESKARAVAAQMEGAALVIGSDQVAVIDAQVLGKPGTHERAVAQLTHASGRMVTFLTGLALVDTESGEVQVDMSPFRVHFRDLPQDQIEAYLDREQPYNSAGSFKSEGLGIALFRRLEGDDPTALIGLPLIRLVDMLRSAGMEPLARL